MVSLFSEYAARRPEDAGGYKIGHITIGDDYDKKIVEQIKNPIEGRNPWSTCGGVKHGKHPNVLFDWKLRNNQYTSLSEGDKYHDPGAHEKQARLEAAEKIKKVHDKPFRNPNPPKKSVGLGNYYGCFNEVNEEDGCRGIRHETEYDVIKKGELPAKRELRPANIKTAPTKRGTYGCMGTLLSNLHLEGNAAEIPRWTGQDYICDPYDRERKMEIERQKKERELLAAMPAPWRSQQRIKGLTFDAPSDSRSTGCSQVYRLTKPLAPKKVLKLTESKPVSDVPFKPPHQGRSGLAGFFGETKGGERQAFPEYREDPYEMKEQKERSDRKKNEPAYGPWKPVSHSQSLQTKSIEFGRGF